MKISKFLAILLASIFAMFAVQSCNTESNVADPSSSNSDEYALYNYDLSSLTMTEASFDSEISFTETEIMRPDLGDTERPLPPHIKQRILLGRVIQAMNLDDEQKAQFRIIMQQHILCEMQWLRKAQAVRKAIQDRANAERRQIMANLNDGEIDRVQAKRMLDELNRRVMEAMRNHPINEEVREGLKLCKEEFNEAVAEMLNEEQLVIWNRFIASTVRK